MSIDIRLVSQTSSAIRITKQELQEKLANEFTIKSMWPDEGDLVESFEIEPKNADNLEDLTFEFHVQDDGTLWHPAVVDSNGDFSLDQ